MNSFCVGYQDSSLVFFDTISGSAKATVKLSDTDSNQINKVTSHPSANLVVCGMEDGSIVAVDTNTHQILAQTNANSAAISSLCYDHAGL